VIKRPISEQDQWIVDTNNAVTGIAPAGTGKETTLVSATTDAATGDITHLVGPNGYPNPLVRNGASRFSTQWPTKLADGASATWTSDNSTVVLSSANTVFQHPDHPQITMRSIVMTPNSASSRAVLLSQTAFTVKDVITFAFNFPDPPGASSISIHLSSDNFATKSVNFAWSRAASYRAKGGVNYLTVAMVDAGGSPGVGGGDSPAGWTSTGGQLITDTFNSIKIQFYGYSGVAVTFLGAWTSESGKGKVILGFDDGFASQYNIAYPYCSARSIPLTIAIPSDFPDTVGYVTTVQMDEMYASGLVDFVGHGKTHVDLTTLTAAQVVAELQHSKSFLVNNYDRGADCMVYPSNAWNASVMAIAKQCGFRFARSINRQFISDHIFGMDYFMAMGAVTTSSNTLASLEQSVDAAANSGQTLYLYAHNILATNNPGGLGGAPPAVPTDMYKDDFYALVDYIAAHIGITAVSWNQFQREMLSVPAFIV